MSANLVGDAIGSLSTIELSLLLMASYCHDIGMSPRRQKISEHYSWLITGDTSKLPKVDREQFQSWLDTNRSGLTAPVEKDRITLSGLTIVDDAVAYYSRSRHNDWSEEFIRSELSLSGLSLYPGWIEDLVILCRSHHEGLSDLRSSRFNAKNVGSPANPINLRFLAAVLRLADVLEFAPERTPEVVLKNRGIAPSSRIYWYKDHSISFEIDAVNHQLIFSAQTPNALIHKAVLMTADWVNAELALCATLSQENAFTSGVVAAGRAAVYKWEWPSRLVSDIRELPGTFIFIDGSFRPDTQKVLALLSGTALYQRPIVAVRELIQNSLDAIREQIAYSRLEMDNPRDVHALNYLSNFHQVTVTFTQSDGKYLLICEDNGSGMTRSIIEQHLLISGSGIRGESRRLERAARDAGFLVERTGRFGIGVLSYFMLANALTITTRRSQEAGDHDASGWQFAINGLDGFGELSKDTRAGKGTVVSLELKDSALEPSPESFFKRLQVYVSQTFRWLPCKLVLRDDVGVSDPVAMGPEWAHDVAFDKEKIVASIFRNDEPGKKGFASEEETEIFLAKSRRVKSMTDIANSALRWTPVVEIKLDNDEGVLRGSIPYFLIDGSSSVLFSDTEKLNGDFAWGEDAFRRPVISNFTSLHGITIEFGAGKFNDCHLDVDLRKAAEIMVDRSRLIEPMSGSVLSQIRKFRSAMWRDFLKANTASPFNEINVSASSLSAAQKSEYCRQVPYWLLRKENGAPASLESCDQSVSSVGRFSFYNWTDFHITASGGGLEAVPIGTGSDDRLMRLHHLYGGGKLIIQPGERNAMFGLAWESPNAFQVIDGTVGSMCALFPDNWRGVAAVNMHGRVIYNLDHELIKRLAHVKPKSTQAPNREAIDRAIIMASRDEVFAERFVIESLSWGRRYWKWVQENEQASISSIYGKFIAADSSLLVANSRTFETNNMNTDILRALSSSLAIEAPYLPVDETHQMVVDDVRERKRK
ncbi:ATP-binding protein [Sphingomonas sp. OK281]|uniref:HD domain-containing protein n=1 Tax=Sphingomonas sp. OK281 TaxID=1881067 RepID=UPI0015870481|nr:ATP-binding protein [Sphingomonas sp. OK281]